jgi:hypothetical protein
MKLVYKVVQSTSDLVNLKDLWVALDIETQHQNISSSYNWIYNWWMVFKKVENNKFGFEKELIIVCGYNNHKLELVCPLIKLKRKKYGFSFTFIEFLGQQWSGVYYDIISLKGHKNMFTEVHRFIKSNFKFDFIHLRYIPDSSEHYKTNFLFNFSQCPEITISDYLSFEDYLKSNYSKGHKQNLRTGLNRAKKENNELEKTIENLDDKNYSKVVNLSKSKLNDNKAWLYGDNQKFNFYKKIHKCFDSNVVFVKVNGIEVAYRTNLIFNRLKLCTDASYDRNAPRYELGIHSVDENIKDSFNKKIINHSLGPGMDPYKLKFTKKTNNLKILFLKGNTIKSCFYILLKNIFLK